MGNSRTKPFMSFDLYTILSSEVKSHGPLLYPAQNVNHPFIQHVHTVYQPPISHLIAIWVIRSSVTNCSAMFK